MTDQFPSDLLKLKIRLDAWRKKRKYLREPIPDEFRREALKLCRRYPHSLIHRALKIQPSRLKSPNRRRQTKSATTAARARARKQPTTAFFELPIGVVPPNAATAAAPERVANSRLVIERADGARLTIFLPGLDQASLSTLCANFLHS
jgi:hypothetical protein